MVLKGSGGVSKPNVVWALVAHVGVFEKNYLCFVWFNGEASSVEPGPAVIVSRAEVVSDFREV